MLGGRIAKPAKPRERPDEPDRSEQDEHRSPVHDPEQRGRQKRSESAHEVRAHEENALHGAALAPRKPARERARDVRPRAGFSRTEEKTHGQQRRIAEHEAREHGKRRPPADDARQHTPRAHPVAPPARRDLEERVGQIERAEDVAHLRGIELEIARDVRPRHADGDPIEIGNGRQRHRHGEHFPPDAGITRSRHSRSDGQGH